jgi:hypothetical protein
MNVEQWRMRAHACVEVMLLLVFKVDAEVGWFGDTLQVLGDIGSVAGMHNLSSSGKDEVFVVRWTCLSIMAIQSALKGRRMSHHCYYKWGFALRDGVWSSAEEKAREIDETLEHRWGTHECQLLSKISFAADIMQKLDMISAVQIDEVVLRMAPQLPGVHLDFPDLDPFDNLSTYSAILPNYNLYVVISPSTSFSTSSSE